MRSAGCQVPQVTGRATEATPEALYGLFRDWQRTQTQSSVIAPTSLRPQMDVRFCISAETICREAYVRSKRFPIRPRTRSPERAKKTRAFQLTSDLHGSRSLARHLTLGLSFVASKLTDLRVPQPKQPAVSAPTGKERIKSKSRNEESLSTSRTGP